MGPLKGIKVIDMTTVLMGPYATQMLGDYGADVIKVESHDGDVTRQIGPTRHPGMGPVFLNTNRNKRSICLDLKKPAGREAVLRLIKSADVLVYNVRPQAMARLNLGYDVVSEINPRLIYAGVFGFGQDGPYAAKPAYDDLIQGATALPALMAQTADGVPRYVPNALVDRIVGLTAVGAISASLVDRNRTGRGQRVDIPMFETMAGFVMGDHMGGLTYEPPLDKGGYARHLSPDRRPYRTSDGYICVIVYNDTERPVRLRIFHPDGDGSHPEQEWTLPAGADSLLGEGFGNDWGVRGDQACLSTVGVLAHWGDGTFTLTWTGDSLRAGPPPNRAEP